MDLKKITLYFIGVILLTGATSCKDELGDINQNPNEVENPQPAYLLTGAIKTATDAYWNVNESNPSNLFVQYWSAIQYTEEDRYIFTRSSFQNLWTTLYTGSLVNLDKIIEISEENKNFRGVAMVLRSWNYCLLTDVFGSIPYAQSINIEEYADPEYQTQEEVYEGLLNDLKTAQQLLDPNGESIQGDIIYQGDISLWKKLANSLRLRIALRIADKEPQKAQTALTNIEQNGNNYIGSNQETAQLVYEDSPNDNPLYEQFLA